MSARTAAVLGLLLAGALGLLAATQPWATVALVDGRELATNGQELAPSLALLAFVAIALALVLPIAGRIWRLVLGALAIVVGGVLLLESNAAATGVGAAIEALVAEATGLAGTAQSAELDGMTATGWPAAGSIAGALAGLTGLWVLITGRRWPARAPRAARYERSGSGLAWDVMDDGDDPTR